MVVNSAAGSNKTAFRIEPDASVQLPNDSQKLQFGNDQDLNIWHGGSNGYIDNETGNLSVRTTSSNTERLRITSDGKLGVGNFTSGTAVSQALHVKGSAPAIFLEHTGGYDMTLTTSDGMGQNGITVSGGALSLAYDNKNIWMCRNGGYVGINQTSPQRYLHITGNDGATGATLGNSDTLLVLDNQGVNGPIIEFASATNGAGRIQFTDTDAANRGRLEYLHTDDSMRIRTAGSERLIINDSGALGLNGANYGSSGQVLTSQGSGSSATWSTVGGKVVNYDSTIVTAAGSASVGQGNYSNNIIGLSYAAASSSNKLLLIASVSVGYQHGQSVASRFTVSGGAITGATGDASGNRRRATTAAWINSRYQVTNMTLVYEHSSPSTSAVTYGVQLGQSDNGTQTVYWNRSEYDDNYNWRIRAVTTLTIIELEG